MQIVHRESHTEQLFFTSRPDHATRKALRAAGWRFNGMGWWRNANTTAIQKAKDLPGFLTPAEQPEAAATA